MACPRHPFAAIAQVDFPDIFLIRADTAKSFPVCEHKIHYFIEYFLCSPTQGIGPATH
jgi:hypothetical protein